MQEDSSEDAHSWRQRFWEAVEHSVWGRPHRTLGVLISVTHYSLILGASTSLNHFLNCNDDDDDDDVHGEIC